MKTLKDLREFVEKTKNLSGDEPLKICFPINSCAVTENGEEKEYFDSFVTLELSKITRIVVSKQESYIEMKSLDPDSVHIIRLWA